jgi:hypothetical protein
MTTEEEIVEKITKKYADKLFDNIDCKSEMIEDIQKEISKMKMEEFLDKLKTNINNQQERNDGEVLNHRRRDKGIPRTPVVNHQRGVTKNKKVSDKSNLAVTNCPDVSGGHVNNVQENGSPIKEENEPTNVDSVNKYPGIDFLIEELDNYNFDVLEDYPKQNFIDSFRRLKMEIELKGGSYLPKHL